MPTPERSLVVCDLDGTLAFNNHREHFLQRDPQDWEQFFLACGDDVPNFGLATVLAGQFAALGARAHFAFITGRGEVCREVTSDWLHRLLPWLTIADWSLHMRPDGSTLPSTLFKEAMLVTKLLEPFPELEPALAFEDNVRDARMYRSHGFEPVLLHPDLETALNG